MTIKKIRIEIEIPKKFLLKGEIEKKLFLQKAKKQKKNEIKLKIISNLGWNDEIENKCNFYKRA